MLESSNDLFRVVLDGTVLAGHDQVTVKAQLAALIKRDVEFASRLLSGHSTAIRSKVDIALGERYVTALRHIGVAASLQPETLEIDADLDLGSLHNPLSPPLSHRNEREQNLGFNEAQPTATSDPAASVPSGTLTTQALYEAFIGEKQRKRYLAKFSYFDKHGNRLAAGLNGAALLCGAGWALYRKMYLWFFAFWGVGFVARIVEQVSSILSAAVVLVSWLAFAIYADAIYHRRARATISNAFSRAKSKNPDTAQSVITSAVLDYLRRKGGVQTWVIWVIALIPIVGIIAAIALPAYQNYAKVANPGTRDASVAGASTPDTGPRTTSARNHGSDSSRDADLLAKIFPLDSTEHRPNLGPTSSEKSDATAVQLNDAEKAGIRGDLRPLQQLADNGNSSAKFALGVLYHGGIGIPQDYVIAAEWFRKAADHGRADAQHLLAQMYASGNGVAKDDTEAAKWYRKAADQGEANAQCRLVNVFALGRGVPKDDAEAMKWSRMTADQGCAVAQNYLGNMYSTGNGVTKSDAEAARWYRKAADQGLVDAQIQLGTIYLSGSEVPQDWVEALKWYSLAAEADIPDRGSIVALRERLARKMTRTQIAKAQLLVREWVLRKSQQ